MGFIEGQVDLLFANETEITSLFQTDSFDAAVEALRPHVKLAAITRGPSGSVILSQGERLTVKAEPVEKVVDTTGAGDQYAAGSCSACRADGRWRNAASSPAWRRPR